MNTPNTITLARIVLVPFVVLFLFVGGNLGHAIALVLFLLASASDWLDGYLARRTGQVTVTGKILDPIADKILVYSLFLSFIHMGQLSFWMVAILLAREFLVMALRVELAARGIVVAASTTAKWKTVLQYAVIVCVFIVLFVRPHFPASILYMVAQIFMAAAVVVAVVSALEYAFEGRKQLHT
jgi:CDP-diacylglycerol--glycerol-3-phosphate 3-phosphatidyltransferase